MANICAWLLHSVSLMLWLLSPSSFTWMMYLFPFSSERKRDPNLGDFWRKTPARSTNLVSGCHIGNSASLTIFDEFLEFSPIYCIKINFEHDKSDLCSKWKWTMCHLLGFLWKNFPMFTYLIQPSLHARWWICISLTSLYAQTHRMIPKCLVTLYCQCSPI